jgi:uncharacterized coiled-coil DUF342 family protein
MTPEERLTRIENAIQALTEVQAKHDTQIAGLTVQVGDLTTQVEKQNAGIRDLIVVSRTLIDSQKETTTQIQEFREAQQATDAKLNALIETVNQLTRNIDRFLQGLQSRTAINNRS